MSNEQTAFQPPHKADLSGVCEPCRDALAANFSDGHEDCPNTQPPKDGPPPLDDWRSCCCGEGERIYEELKAYYERVNRG